jgi:hypothetical protein
VVREVIDRPATAQALMTPLVSLRAGEPLDAQRDRIKVALQIITAENARR